MSIAGRWRIVEMDLWEQETLDLVGPAFVELAPDQTGSLGFIAVEGSVDWRPVRRDGRPGADTSPPELHPRISRSTPSALYVSIARRSRVASRSRCSSAAAPTSAS